MNSAEFTEIQDLFKLFTLSSQTVGFMPTDCKTLVKLGEPK